MSKTLNVLYDEFIHERRTLITIHRDLIKVSARRKFVPVS